MADNRKEQERAELHKMLWNAATDLVHAGGVDAWDFKQYVLGTMFYRYISENIAEYINNGEHAAGNTTFDYAKLSDEEAEQAREDLVQTKGFFILPTELFCNVRKKAAADENLNMTLEAVFNHIEESAKGSESEDNFSGLFDFTEIFKLNNTERIKTQTKTRKKNNIIYQRSYHNFAPTLTTSTKPYRFSNTLFAFCKTSSSIQKPIMLEPDPDIMTRTIPKSNISSLILASSGLNSNATDSKAFPIACTNKSNI